ncbi:subtilisin-like protein [Lentinus tigrinus ALCF2SS1-7]|uniref:tripeptidyl-peptidase II n=1 Tax=Lentinus tigrinus ALCF2SS1-6 TaxID=1328759 RepID=A0A5C2SB02_9APHY|nr:subtilisin-like protein [Lentinus tigrinus ALCF2SS1-6]RPD75087.1 subtilisin-like protein [Lentinus tigrinus ALCF2SS1-7]
MLLVPRLLVAITLGLSVAASVPQLSPRVLHESRSAIPRGWTPVRRASGDMVIPLKVGLVQPNLASIEEYLMDVSHPESSNYGNHWSPAKVAQTFRPTVESIETVRAWLLNSGIESHRIKLSKSGSWITANVTVAEAEELLATEYHVYEHENGHKQIACDKAYHLPEHVSKHVDLVTPTLHFDVKVKHGAPLEKRDGKLHSVGAPGFGPVSPKTTGTIKDIFDELDQCDSQITPNCLRALYDFVYVPLAPKKNTIGIVEYTPQAYVPTDLDLFFTNFSKSQLGQRPVMASIDGGTIDVGGSGFGYNGESNLDLQYAMALVGHKQNVTLYQVGDEVQGASFNNLLDALDGSFCTYEGGDDPNQDGIYPDPYGGYQGAEDCGTFSPAHIISTSYSYDEYELTPAYMERQCAEYAKLGLMGTTVLYSSGDYGVAAYSNNCLNPDGSVSSDGKIFAPAFPSTCPYVTSVGATQVNPGAKVTDPESACAQVIYSGGGFSNVFKMPDYQKSSVEKYLTKYPPPYSTDIYNATGSRAYPDLSANGANYVVAIQGEYYLVYGTSASSPVMAAILSGINDARLAIGKKPIGFINPTIYSSTFQKAFNDITNGTNPGCGTAGFYAQPGWDPVTGVGTPNFPKLLALWLLLP